MLLSEEELAIFHDHKKNFPERFSLRLGVFLENQLIGFTYGWQLERGIFYMGISLVHPDHQRNGIYSELLRATISITKANGFQVIQSNHRAGNNPVIIAKLKTGFVVSGFELSDTMGTLVRLSYFHNEERRKLFNVRASHEKPEGKIRELFY